MKLLHTGDWHLGKVLKGMPRVEEHAEVLAELVALAAVERIDAVLVAGDLFETAAPAPEIQRLAWSTLIELRATGAEVIVVAGNHDHPELFEAVRPVFHAAGIRVLGRPARPADGGVIELTTRSGERLRVASLPFCSQRSVVRAEQLMTLDAADQALEYSERMTNLLRALTTGFTIDAVNVVLAHAYVLGGRLGGGERDAQTVNDYAVRATSFPVAASYVALGHLHRFQQIPGPCPIYYSGSPIAVDFGEERDDKGVAIVEVSPGLPATVRHHTLAAARLLATTRGTVAEVIAEATGRPDAWWRAIVTEPARAGMADDVRAGAPNVLEVRIEAVAGGRRDGEGTERRQGRSPHELFAAYLVQQDIADERLIGLFDELLEADEAFDHNGGVEPVPVGGDAR